MASEYNLSSSSEIVSLGDFNDYVENVLRVLKVCMMGMVKGKKCGRKKIA